MRSEKDKMLAGELYRADSPELIADNRRISTWMERFNATTATPEQRPALMQEAFRHAGRGVTIRRPSIATMATTSAWATESSSTSTA